MYTQSKNQIIGTKYNIGTIINLILHLILFLHKPTVFFMPIMSQQIKNIKHCNIN